MRVELHCNAQGVPGSISLLLHSPISRLYAAACFTHNPICRIGSDFINVLFFQVTTPSFGPMTTHELLHHMTGKGLSAKYQFPRQPCLYQASMVGVQVILSNNSDHCLEKIHIGETSPASLSIHCFNTIGQFKLHMCKIIPSQLTKELQPLVNPLNKSFLFIKPRRYLNF